jgi:hypothetical protein
LEIEQMRIHFVLAISPLLFAASNLASACDESVAGTQGQGVSNSPLATSVGTFRVITVGDRRRLEFTPIGKSDPRTLMEDMKPDYVETEILEIAAGGPVVLQDHYFETDEDEPAYHWKLFSADKMLGEFSSMDAPAAERRDHGWRIATGPTSGSSSWFTLCDGADQLLDGDSIAECGGK